jgi:metal-dependent amidase/aminoacylase/carboxypeptidase family protein
MAALDDILAGYEALRPAPEALYQDLHRHPGLSHEEHHTAQRVGDLLRQDGGPARGGPGLTRALTTPTGGPLCAPESIR